MTVDVAEAAVVTDVRDDHIAPALPNPNRIFVDSSGRRAKWVGRLGNLLGLGCAAYVGMVALGLSGTRVAPMTTIPITQDNRIIAGLSGQTGSIGLRLTETPYVPPVPAASVHRVVTPVRLASAPVKAPRVANPPAKPTTGATTSKPSKPGRSSKPTTGESTTTPSKPSKSDTGKSGTGKSGTSTSDPSSAE